MERKEYSDWNISEEPKQVVPSQCPACSNGDTSEYETSSFALPAGTEVMCGSCGYTMVVK